MKLLFISFWSLNDGLTQAMVLPVIKYLKKKKLVDEVILATPESRLEGLKSNENADFTHLPIKGILSQDFTSGINVLVSMTFGVLKYLRRNNRSITLIWARGSVAGGSAYLISRIFKLPFGVESFEPHAEYMIEGGAWKRGSLKSRLQLFFERKIIANAEVIITVSQSFTRKIIDFRSNRNTYCIPCSVAFDEYKITQSNERFQKEKITGIYVGKFGDIYYSDEFFDLLELLFKSYPEYHQIILSPMVEYAQKELANRQIPKHRYQIRFVSQAEVKDYLKEADIAFCPVRQSPIRKFCSPVKTAEYLAAGLPIIISKDISDDSDFIQQHQIGQVIDFESEIKVPDLASIINRHTPMEIQEIGRKYRDATTNFTVYDQVFEALKI
jgi:glycosyltransferase involved in cell wall biosynthesis